MKVLFAVSSESISEQIIKRYQKEYREILTYKNVYYFDAILKEIQKDKSYDRIVISEDLEPSPTNNYSIMDKTIFEKLDSISDEAQDREGKETNIILICADRRTKNSSLLVKLFSIGIYNALIENDRNIEKVCSLIKRPRTKKEAKAYYKIDADDATYKTERENEVSEIEIQNILNYFKKISKNPEKFSEGFNNIATQYTDIQLKIIINCLPIKVKAVLEKESAKYRELINNKLIYSKAEENLLMKNKEQSGIKVNSIENKNTAKINKPIVIPSAIKKSEKRKVVVTSNNKESKNVVKIQNKNNDGLKKEIQKNINEEKTTSILKPKNVEIENKVKAIKIEKNQNIKVNDSLNDLKKEETIKQEIILTQSKELDEIKENDQIESVKKGRGRPRKYPVSTDIKPKGKRGRPRKLLQEDEESELEEEKITNDIYNNVDIEEKEELVIPVIDEEEIELPSFEEEDDDDEEIELPSFEEDDDDDEDEEIELPSFEEDDDDDEEIELPSFEEEDDDDEEIELPSFEEDDDDEDEEMELPSFEEEEDDDDEEIELPSFEEEEDDDDDDEEIELPSFEEEDDDDDEEMELPSFEEDDDDEDEEMELPSFEEDDDDEDEEMELPSFEEDDDDEDEEMELPSFEDEEEEKIVFNDEYGKENIKINHETNIVSSIKPNIDYTMSTLNSLMTKDKKIVTFLGTSKNGTSFLVNNLAAIFDSMGINTAILDMTKNKNSYYIYTNNEEALRKIAYKSITNLKNGHADGLKVGKNLTVYTALPNDGNDYSNAESILSTLVQNHSLILIDCDFSTDPSYFASCQEIYLVQSMDILTIQPLTMFLRDLKTKGVLDSEKIRVVVNQELKMRSLTSKMVIAGLSFYNDPAMSFMTDLFNKDLVKACTIPYDENAYSKYLDGIVNCKVSISGYSKNFISKLKVLAEMVYPRVPQSTYQSNKRTTNFGNNKFSDDMNNTLEQMRKKY